MTVMNKHEMRVYLRSVHKGKQIRDEESALICRHILQSDVYRQAKVIGAYMPLSREADITPVLLDALNCGKKLVLPLCGDAAGMTLRVVEALEELEPGAYGIPAPKEEAPVFPVQGVDLLLVPLEGIDEAGFRLGKGGGYYDRLLMNAHIVTIGCALSWQFTRHVPHDIWDVPLAACAMQDGLHYFTDDLCRKDLYYEHAEKAEDRKGVQTFSEGRSL